MNCTPGQGAINQDCNFAKSTIFRDLNARGSVLIGSNFTEADLSGADLRGSALNGSCFVDAVLLDAHMPEMDGFTVARHMQQEPALAGTTILMLSSADLTGDATRCREVGIVRHLMKPITQAGLWDAILASLSSAVHVAPPTIS